MRDTTPAVEREIEWTPRQREVLDLLARGRTNPEIAEALGVSLAGAKWHVSEVISKLGVSSREEAAAWWREHGQPRRRLSRALRGFAAMPSLGLGRAGVSAAVILLAAGTAGTIALATRGSNSPPEHPAQEAAAQQDSGFTIEEARARAYLLAQTEIDSNRFWDDVLVDGRKIEASDLVILDEHLVPAASVVRSRARATEWRGGQGERVWAFTLERSELDVPGTDGRASAFVIFEDGTGEKKVVSLGGPNVIDPPRGPLAEWDRAATLGTTIVAGLEWVIKAERLSDGSECMLNNDPRVPLGGWATGCGSPFVGGTWPFIVRPAVWPGGQVFWGAAGNGVESIQLNLGDGSTQMVELKPLPPELPLGWRWFLVGIEGDIDVLSADGLAADGSLVYSMGLGPWGDRSKAVPAGQEGQQHLEASGDGAGRTADVAIKPAPAFPKLFVTFGYRGTDPVSVDIVCGETRVTVINNLAPDGSFEMHAPIDIPTGATSCHYEVSAVGAWTLRSS